MLLEPDDDRRLILTSRDPWGASIDRAVRREIGAGRLSRVRRGVARPRLVALKELSRDDRYVEERLRHLDEIEAVRATRRSDIVVSHVSALAVHGLPWLGRWPKSVDILESPESNRRSKNGVIVHRRATPEADVVEVGDLLVTSPARTIADLARAGNAIASVVALDFALGSHAPGMLHTTKEQVLEILAADSSWGGSRAARIIEFADARSGSPGESGGRVLFAKWGFEAPDLQASYPSPSGGHYDVDFRWPRSRFGKPLVGEFDGIGKYVREEYLRGRTPGEAVVAEKKREDWIRRCDGSSFMRWGMKELLHPSALRSLATEQGVPLARRRAKSD
jgi:hypothetical protein